ncbi:DedA family protein [bacterium]|nr:MAG: DedA family protein [bacterium]
MPQRLFDMAMAQGPLVYGVLFLAFLFQTGFLIGFVLPGNPLVFLAGAVSATGRLNSLLVWLVLGAGAFCGNLLNYAQGKKAGPAFKRRERWRESIERAEGFFSKHGGRTVAIAAFVPFYRAWVPFVAGMGRMPFASYIVASAVGAFGWIGAWTLLGRLLGEVAFIKNNLDKIMLGIVLLVSVVAIVKVVQVRKAKKASPAETPL